MRSEAFDGEDYHEFAQLVESIQRTDALRDRVSERTIADYAFDWFKETRRLGTSLALTDYILERVNASVRPLEVCVPIAMLSLESPVSIGRVILRTVDRETLRHNKFPEIFAVGDATNLPVSKAGAAAHHQAKIIGPNIASILKGEEPKKKYDGHVQCFLMTSLKTSIFLDFNYHHPPRRYGLFSNTGWYIAKRLFKPMFFRLVLSGRV